jgi:hypothetical protein
MQAASRRRRPGSLGVAVVGDDPLHDSLEVGAVGEDRSALDHDTARCVRTRQSAYKCVDLAIVHLSHRSPSARFPRSRAASTPAHGYVPDATRDVRADVRVSRSQVEQRRQQQ